MGIPMEKLADEKAANKKLMANSVAVGAAVAMGGYEFELLEQVLKEHFTHLGKDTVEANVRAATAGYEDARLLKLTAVRQRVKPGTFSEIMF